MTIYKTYVVLGAGGTLLNKNEEKIYVLAGIVFLLLACNVIRTVPDTIEDVSTYPDMDYSAIIAEYKALHVEVQKPLASGDAYYDFHERLGRLEKGIKKYHRSNPRIMDPRIRDAGVLGSELSNIREDHIKRGGGIDWNEIQQALKRFDQKPKDPIRFEDNSAKVHKFLEALLFFQFGFTPFILLVYAIRVKNMGGSVLFEALSNPWFPIYLFVWEIGIFKYNATGLRTQIRMMVRYASLTLSAVLSFGATTLKAQTKNEKDDTGGNNGHTLIISGSTHYLSKYLGLDGAIFHPESVLQSSTTIAHKSGLYGNFWKSVALTDIRINPNFGREEDYTLGYNRKLFGRGFDTSITWFNVTPLRKLPRGDLIQISLMISDLTAKLPVSTYLWVRTVEPIKDGKPLGGWFAHFGVNKGVKLNRKIELALNAEAVRDSGAFGFKKAGIFRSSVTLRVPWKKVVFDLPTFRMSSQFTHPGDGRKFEQVLGVGMTFSIAR